MYAANKVSASLSICGVRVGRRVKLHWTCTLDMRGMSSKAAPKKALSAALAVLLEVGIVPQLLTACDSTAHNSQRSKQGALPGLGRARQVRQDDAAGPRTTATHAGRRCTRTASCAAVVQLRHTSSLSSLCASG